MAEGKFCTLAEPLSSLGQEGSSVLADVAGNKLARSWRLEEDSKLSHYEAKERMGCHFQEAGRTRMWVQASVNEWDEDACYSSLARVSGRDSEWGNQNACGFFQNTKLFSTSDIL